MASGLTQVCRLWLDMSKGMLPVWHLAPKIMAVNHCGRQLVRRWAAPAYHDKEGATPHTVACTFSLQYEEKPGVHFGVRFVTWYLGSVSEDGGEVCEELTRRMIDVCVVCRRWDGEGWVLGMKERRYGLWWSGDGDGVCGVGLMVTEELCEEVVDVWMVSDSVMAVVVWWWRWSWWCGSYGDRGAVWRGGRRMNGKW